MKGGCLGISGYFLFFIRYLEREMGVTVVGRDSVWWGLFGASVRTRALLSLALKKNFVSLLILLKIIA